MTDPTNLHIEQAREILLDCEQVTGMYLGSCSEPNDLVDRIAAALVSRDSEIREVLEGLRTYTTSDCWCGFPAPDRQHEDRCLAARELYKKAGGSL